MIESFHCMVLHETQVKYLKLQEIQNQLNNIDWLIQFSEYTHTLEKAAIKKVLIDHNPSKDKIPLVWKLDFNNEINLQHLKNYTGER